jgi:phage terminase large subunit GpA-like protein
MNSNRNIKNITQSPHRSLTRHDSTDQYGPALTCPHCGYNEFSLHLSDIEGVYDKKSFEPVYETVAVCAFCACIINDSEEGELKSKK